MLLLGCDTVPTRKQLPTFRGRLVLYIQCTGSLGLPPVSIGKNLAVVISGFRRVLLGYYAASSGNFYRRFGTTCCLIFKNQEPKKTDS